MCIYTHIHTHIYAYAYISRLLLGVGGEDWRVLGVVHFALDPALHVLAAARRRACDLELKRLQNKRNEDGNDLYL